MRWSTWCATFWLVASMIIFFNKTDQQHSNGQVSETSVIVSFLLHLYGWRVRAYIFLCLLCVMKNSIECCLLSVYQVIACSELFWIRLFILQVVFILLYVVVVCCKRPHARRSTAAAAIRASQPSNRPSSQSSAQPSSQPSTQPSGRPFT